MKEMVWGDELVPDYFTQVEKGGFFWMAFFLFRKQYPT